MYLSRGLTPLFIIDPFLGLLGSPVGEDFGGCCVDLSK